MSVPLDALIDGRIKWGPIPKWNGTSIVNTVDKKETIQESAYNPNFSQIYSKTLSIITVSYSSPLSSEYISATRRMEGGYGCHRKDILLVSECKEHVVAFSI